MTLRTFLKRLTPLWLRGLRHFFYAWLGAVRYGHPSEKLFVIGVTGTSGKSSTIYFLRQILESCGFRVGALSTIEFYVAGKQQWNDKKMTMLGKMEIQRFLREMVQQQCDVAIIETTSEGRMQHRHRYINYDMMILTNLYPEHIEAHGSFESYIQAKADIFSYVARSKRKKLVDLSLARFSENRTPLIPKTCIVNGNSEYTPRFLLQSFDQRLVFVDERYSAYGEKQDEVFVLRDVAQGSGNMTFTLNELSFHTSVTGEHNSMNIAAALAVARAWYIDWSSLQDAVGRLTSPPGRIEQIEEAHRFGFHVIVDYAFEPVAMEKLYAVVASLSPSRIIHVFGSTGGGRDKARRATVGEFVATRADICIITDEDPYDDDPLEIISDVAAAVRKTGKKDNEDLFIVPHRGEAIRYAIALAKKGDVILITGKGSEQAMVVQGKLIPWDDRDIVRHCLRTVY